MSDNNNREPTPKIGAGHLQAMGRLGLAELRAAVYPGSEIAQSDPGVFGNATQSEVVGQRREEPQSPTEDRGGVVDDRLRQAERQAEAQRSAPGRESPTHDKE